MDPSKKDEDVLRGTMTCATDEDGIICFLNQVQYVQYVRCVIYFSFFLSNPLVLLLHIIYFTFPAVLLYLSCLHIFFRHIRLIFPFDAAYNTLF